jgi:hypothetical protein
LLFVNPLLFESVKRLTHLAGESFSFFTKSLLLP